MRILVVPSWFPSPQAPLSGIFFAEQTELLAKHAPAVEVHVFAVPRRTREIPFKRPAEAARVLREWGGASKYRRRDVSSNYVVHTFESLTWSSRVAHGGLVYEARRMLRVAREIERERGPIDLVHAHVSHPGGFVAEELARRLGVPLVVSEHMSPFPFDDLFGPDGNPLPDVMSPIRNAVRVTAVSRAHAQSINRFIDRPIDVMPNFIDESQFSPGSHAAGAPMHFLSVGHLCSQKGFDVLLRALRIALDEGVPLRLSIVGKGHLRDELQALAIDLGVDHAVTWVGAPDRALMPDLYRSADAFVLASRHESFGVVVIEALASGLPVAATKCGGPEEIVTDECGRLAPPEDPAALATAMADIARTTFDRDRIRAYFDAKYASSAVVPRLEQLYRDVLEESRATARRAAAV